MLKGVFVIHACIGVNAKLVCNWLLFNSDGMGKHLQKTHESIQDGFESFPGLQGKVSSLLLTILM